MTEENAHFQPNFKPGNVSYTPTKIGDGYNWGGEIIVTFGEKSIVVAGCDPMKGFLPEDVMLAKAIADAPLVPWLREINKEQRDKNSKLIKLLIDALEVAKAKLENHINVPGVREHVLPCVEKALSEC